MKSVFVLLVLLNAQSLKVCSQPYQVDPGERCHDEAREYMPDDTNLCCKRCPPGQRLNRECSETSESECADCGPLLYIHTWNYNKNCFMCTKCKENKGLQYAQTCSSTTNAQCVCQPGMFCLMDFRDPYCRECKKYKSCKVGYGVSKPGSADSDVKCERCPSGTFSDTVSFTDRCRPHTQCGESAVVNQGNATADTVCEHQTTKESPDTQTVLATASTVKSTVETKWLSVAPRSLRGSTPPARPPSASEETFTTSTRGTPPTTESRKDLVAAVAGVIGSIFLLIILVLLCFCKRVWRKGSARLQPKVDANGNCEGADNVSLAFSDHISTNFSGDYHKASFTVVSSEQKCLLEKLEASNGPSQQSSHIDASTRTDGDNSQECISPLQSTLPCNSLNSAMSEPLTLLSNTEPFSAQSSAPTQSSSQPTSPQIISPVSPSPHVNVNITLNIGNGSCGPPSLGPANVMQADRNLPFGEEEESFRTPQQEDGKQSIMAVAESESCTTSGLICT